MRTYVYREHLTIHITPLIFHFHRWRKFSLISAFCTPIFHTGSLNSFGSYVFHNRTLNSNCMHKYRNIRNYTGGLNTHPLKLKSGCCIALWDVITNLYSGLSWIILICNPLAYQGVYRANRCIFLTSSAASHKTPITLIAIMPQDQPVSQA